MSVKGMFKYGVKNKLIFNQMVKSGILEVF